MGGEADKIFEIIFCPSPLSCQFLRDQVTPVGPIYRPTIARGIMDAIGTVLDGKPWPRLK